MTAVRLALAALLVVLAATVEAAPAPLPKLCRVADSPAAVEHLKKALGGTGIHVKSVEREGRVWLVTFYDYRMGGCGNLTPRERLRCRGFVAPTRSAAMAALLRDALLEHERDMAKLRAKGVIP
jgi:hypothetical protein